MSAGFSWKWRAIIPFLAEEQDVVRSNTITRASHGSDGPPEKKSNTTKVQTQAIDKWALRAAQQKKGKVSGPSWVAGRPPWSADQPMAPTALSLWHGTPSLDGEVGSKRPLLKFRLWRGWLPSINMRGGAPFHGMEKLVKSYSLKM